MDSYEATGVAGATDQNILEIGLHEVLSFWAANTEGEIIFTLTTLFMS